MKNRVITALCVVFVVLSCGTAKKAKTLEKQNLQAVLALAKDRDFRPDSAAVKTVQKDTIVVKDEKGNDIFFMKAIKDETGDMVATEVLDAAVVTARFRNIAERHGKVDIEFQVIVPASMQDSKWQLRFYPDMFALEDSIRLDPVVITGEQYRRTQMRGYERYNNWLSGIVEDSTKFINMNQLEIFIQRNFPDFYRMKEDSTYVSDEQFTSVYGITEKEAIEHYTNKIARAMNEKRKAAKDRKFKRLVKVPIVTEGLRLDTVMRSSNGEFVYNYVQTINTRPKLRKVDVKISGEIYEQDKKVYNIPRTEPLTFYISSLSSFVDETERYMTKVIERRVEAAMSYFVEFESGKFNINPSLADNRKELSKIKHNIATLIENSVFDLDSIMVVSYASPEGGADFNKSLSEKRAAAICSYMSSYVVHYRDSLSRANESYEIDFETGETKKQDLGYATVRFTSRSAGENWELLDQLVAQDSTIAARGWEKGYNSARKIKNLDKREAALKNEPSYQYIRTKFYPRLRKVDFNFHLHRKGMVKDTVHTTVIDTNYMNGVQAIKDRDYEKAIEILTPYKDYNLAIAYVAMDRNYNALTILEALEGEKRTAQVNYMLAILYARHGDDQKAVQCYLDSCRQNPTYVHRGNLDPEISALIKKYGLNKQDDDEFLL